MTLTARLYAEGADHAEVVDIESVDSGLDDRSLLWVDVDPDRAQLTQVDERLGLGESTRELAGSPTDTIAFRAETIGLSVFGLAAAQDRTEPVRLHLLLARNIVVSVHDQPILGLADPVRVASQDPRFGRLDAGRFAGLLLDGVLHGYMRALEDLERDIDALDDRALRRHPREDLLVEMVRLRRRIAILRRSLAPQREVFTALTRPIDSEPSPIGVPDADLLARLERTIDAVERTREQLLGTFDIVMTRTGQRTNDVMRVLTVLSAVLLPSAVIAGLMGMNFEVPGFFDEPSNFFVVVMVMVAIGVLTLAVARWRNWL